MDVLKYQPVIEKVLAKRKIGRNQREDVVQECYLALLENPDRLSGPDDEAQAALICRSRIEEIFKTRLRLSKEDRPKFVSADVPIIAKQLDKIAIQNDGEISESELYAAIESLPEEDRQVIKERFIEGLTQTQTCDKLNLTVEAVKWRQKRGVAALKKFFEVDNG